MDPAGPTIGGWLLGLCVISGVVQAAFPTPSSRPGLAGCHLVLFLPNPTLGRARWSSLLCLAPPFLCFFSQAGSCWDLERLYLSPFTCGPAPSLEAGSAGSWTTGPRVHSGLVWSGWAEVPVSRSMMQAQRSVICEAPELASPGPPGLSLWLDVTRPLSGMSVIC